MIPILCSNFLTVSSNVANENTLQNEDTKDDTFIHTVNETKYSADTIRDGRLIDDTYFISLWNTTLTSTGSSENNQVRLPLESDGTYDFIVDWGDGERNTITSWDQL